MPTKKLSVGWIGAGRMGYEMAGRLAKGGADVLVWNRTREKAAPLTKYGAKVADQVSELAARDIVFCMVSAWKDVKEVMTNLLANSKSRPGTVVECSSISLEGSAELRQLLEKNKIQYLAAPVSGNAKVIKAGKLTFVCSGPKKAFDLARPFLDLIAVNSSYVGEGELSRIVCSGPRSAFDAAEPYLKLIGPAASYVGEGELARIVKICHNVFLGVVTQSLAEITLLAQKAGVPRHAFLEFMNQSVMGSTFTRYKTPAFVNLDFKVTFTPQLLRKDMDLGLDAGRKFEVPMPLASATRDLIQSMIGQGWTEQDFATLLLQQAEASGIKLKPENVEVGDGLS